MPLVGTLSTLSLPDLLQWLATASKSGTLQVERNKVARWIQMSRGRVVGCSSDDPPHRLGHYLLSRGKVTEEQLREALATQERTAQHLGRILVEMGVLSSEDLTHHLEAKAEETIYSLFDWEDAVFRFDETLDRRDDVFPVDLQVQDILLRGLKRFDEMLRIRQVFHEPGIVLRYTEKPPPFEVFSNKMARALYATIDSERTIADILLHVHGSEYVVYKFLFELHRNGYVEISHVKPGVAAPVVVPATASELELEPLAPAHAAPRRSSAAAQPFRAEPSAPPRPGASVLPAGSQRVAVDAAGAPLGLEGQLAQARQLLGDSRFEEALDVLDRLYREHPADDALRRLSAEAEAAFIDKAYRHYLPPDRVPVLMTAVENLESLRLSPAEYFLLSRIDGTWDIKSIIQIAPLREVEALRTLKRMRENGTIRLADPS